ncbi:hypothetical protein ACFQ61_07715 [Streptomyces sp. NPDC056500]|uniref:hypothetical protein n=1 Tax=Streptomyces sp. NPDC056500 TaxID=3345840 RepID=UPI0036B2C725
MSNSYAQAVLRTAGLAEALRVADQLIDLADTRQLEVDFEAVVHRADELERSAKVMPDVNWWPRGPGRSGSSRDGDSAFECLPVVLSRWTTPGSGGGLLGGGGGCSGPGALGFQRLARST